MPTVASYNIRKSVGLDWQRQPRRILEVISALDADIVALQEVDKRFGSRATSLHPETIAEATPYKALNFAQRPQGLGWHGNTILVRKQAEVTLERRLVLPALEPRGAVLADIAVDGAVLRVIGVHLGLMGRWRIRQARAVLAHLEALDHRRPTVIMGDLNQWTMEGGCLIDFSRDHHVVTPGPSFHARHPTLSLDRIITSRDVHVEACGVFRSPLAQEASDHLPVWARLRLNQSEHAAHGVQAVKSPT